jgi:hypothetical protein
MRAAKIPDCAEPVVGRAFARPVGSILATNYEAKKHAKATSLASNETRQHKENAMERSETHRFHVWWVSPRSTHPTAPQVLSSPSGAIKTTDGK